MPWKIAPAAETFAEFLIPRPRELRGAKGRFQRHVRGAGTFDAVEEAGQRLRSVVGKVLASPENDAGFNANSFNNGA